MAPLNLPDRRGHSISGIRTHPCRDISIGNESGAIKLAAGRGFSSTISTYLILIASVLALTLPNTAYEQERDMIPGSEGAAYGLSYPLLGNQTGILRFAPTIPQIMHEIAICESGGRQFDKKGNVVRGEIHVADLGKYQINSAVWGKEARKLGHDLSTEEGNEQFALELYRRFDTKPWDSSKACWGKYKT